MNKTVTQSYIAGIVEGRATLNALRAQGFAIDADLARNVLDNCRSVQALGFAGVMAEYNRGQLDFWRNQVKQMEVVR